MIKTLFALSIFLLSQLISGQTNYQDIVIGKSFDLSSKHLNTSRQIYVTYPEDHQSESYPLAILVGAEANDFRASILKDEFVVLGVRSDDFKADFLNSRSRMSFLKFLVDELVPFAEQEFNTSQICLITGHSLAGVVVMEALMSMPKAFSFYVSTSPALQLADRNAMNTFRIDQPKGLYFSIGRDEGYPELEQANHAFHFQLDSLLIPQLHWKFEVLKNETHKSSAYTGFCRGYSFYRSFSTVPDSILNKDIVSIEKYIANMNTQFGIKIPIDEDVLMPHILLNFSDKLYANIAETIKYISTNQPELIRQETDIMLELARELRIKGGHAMAYDTFKIIYELTDNEESKRNMEELKQGY